MEIEKVTTIEDAKKCNELLTKLIKSEKKYNNNINEKYEVTEWFEKVYNEKYNTIYVAKIENKIVGYIYCKINSIDNGPTLKREGLIDGLYVEEEYRKQGIATKLMEAAKEWAKKMEIKYVFLNVLEENKNAMNLYLKNEFKNFERKLKLEL